MRVCCIVWCGKVTRGFRSALRKHRLCCHLNAMLMLVPLLCLVFSPVSLVFSRRTVTSSGSCYTLQTSFWVIVFQLKISTKLTVTVQRLPLLPVNHPLFALWTSWSRGSSIGAESRLRAGRSEIRIPRGTRYFSILQNIHYSYCSLVTGVLSLGVKRSGK